MASAVPFSKDVLQNCDGIPLMGFYGLAQTLQGAVALAEAFGPGAVLGFGAWEAGFCNILAPKTGLLAPDEVSAVAGLGRSSYFFSFGDAGWEGLEAAGGVIEHLAAASQVGFMAACIAAPALGRTVYQGQLFENGALRGDVARAMGLGGGAAVVPREIVAAGAGAIRAQCARMKEQGKTLALLDAINEDDHGAVREALAGMMLAGGAAAFAGLGGEWPDDAISGQVGILSGALDRQTLFQIGAARAALPVYEVNFAARDPVGEALIWAAAQRHSSYIITSSVPPDRLTAGAPAAALLGDIARGLQAAGVRRFVIAGGQTAAAVCAALNVKSLQANSKSGLFLWLGNETTSISFKPSGAGPKNLFLSEFEPQLSRKQQAELAS